jgi:hypothetical protein
MDASKLYKSIGFGAMDAISSKNGPEIVGVGSLHGPLTPGNLSEKVGGEAPHLFRQVSM